jgi:signal peptidase I
MLIVLPIRLFVAQPFIVSGASMQPTFATGDYLIIDQITYDFQPPERQDVVVFRYPNDPSKFFIKRIIGLPGETIEITDRGTKIINKDHPNGFTLDEPYIESSADNGSVTTTLESDQYFVLGDNRDSSSDSRSWGPLAKEFLIGRAYLRLLPPENIAVTPGYSRADTGAEAASETP